MDGRGVEVRDMRDAETTLAIIRERGRRGLHLERRWQGRGERPRWVQYMLARRRKTLVACHGCHTAIHAGRPTRIRPTQDPADRTSTTGEPDAVKVARPVRRGADGKGAGGAT